MTVLISDGWEHKAWTMADGYHLCVEAPTSPPPGGRGQDETYILNVKFHGSGESDYKVDYERLQRNLMTEYLRGRFGDKYHERLIKVTFHDFTPKEDANAFCQKALERGIFCRQGVFNFLGHSETQLKQKSCYLMKASHEEIHDMLVQVGDSLGERDVRKRARKIGRVFSPLNKGIAMNPIRISIKPHTRIWHSLRWYTPTNGCGFMSRTFSSKVQTILKIDYEPSVVKVRYRGMEACLVLNEASNFEMELEFHGSTEEYKAGDERNRKSNDLVMIGVADYSRPYVNGYLDISMITMLLETGTPAENLKVLQAHYYELLEGLCRKTAELFLLMKGEVLLLHEIQVKGIDNDAIQNSLKFYKEQEVYKMKNACGQTRILVPKSRIVFAVCDPHNKLTPGECYFKPTLSEDETKSFPGAERKVLVMRKPCYHPEEVQVLKLTDDAVEYENLRDCLVLPAIGPRPYVFESTEGFADANEVFVSWSEDLFPKASKKYGSYSARKSVPGKHKLLKLKTSFRIGGSSHGNPRRRVENGRKEMIEYFANFTEDDLTEKIAEIYTAHAATFGPASKGCRNLSELFYQAKYLTEDRVALAKESEKIKENLDKHNAGAASDSVPLTFTKAMRQLTLQQYLQQPELQRNCRHQESKREIETRAKEFVDRYPQDSRMSMSEEFATNNLSSSTWLRVKQTHLPC